MTNDAQILMPRGKARAMSGRMTGWIGGIIVVAMLLTCLLSLPYTIGRIAQPGGQTDLPSTTTPRRFERTNLDEALLPPTWLPMADDERLRVDKFAEQSGRRPTHLLGTDRLGRDLFVRSLAGGSISLGIGLAAAAISVVIGTLYGTIAGYFGGRVDAILMRIVDVLFGLPYVLLVVLLAVAVEGFLERTHSQMGPGGRQLINVITLLVAIGGVSWLTMARVIRGQVLSLRQQPFMEASRAIGVPLRQQFMRHMLPNLLGPIIVYATLTVPAAILSESFLSFLGIGVKEPLPSWGNLAASGLNELNVVRSRWWLLFWPCLLVGMTLLSLNFVGEGLREAFDPKRRVVGT